ncbi:MAG TPA: Fe-S cluster assembly protein SufD [Thermoanaerobaculia bacterium]|nr:Fe-S cluster assembly protein SufD [Thermoanaerobaculia bacterium]
MTVETARRPSYLDRHVAALPARLDQPAAVAELRARARKRFAVLGFPSVNDEEWRFTNVAPLVRRDFEPLLEPGTVTAADVEAASYPGCDRLVFVDGRFSPEHSAIGALPAGVVAGSLGEALASGSEILEANLGRHTVVDHHAFTALNTALFVDGAFIVVPRGTVLERPIQIVNLASSAAAGRAVHPRHLIVALEASQASVVETYGGSGEYFTGVVTELHAGDGSHLRHYRMQRESRGAYHFATIQGWLARSSVLASHNVSLGGRMVRNDVVALLDGEGAEGIFNGLYVAEADQFVDNHMRVEHVAAHCASHELYKGILDGRARAVFNGRIYVHKGAQKTDAKQTNRNLLLSRQALVNSNPQLEIFADDVRCTHGSTVGQLDADAIFYLRSRGIGAEAAKSLLTYAFASEVSQAIDYEPVRRDLEEFLFGRLAEGDVVRQAV